MGLYSNDNFNSHAHVERDANGLPYSENAGISTHTLTWSVTSLFFLSIALKQHFNSHAHVERDYKLLSKVERPQNFNSHAHVERDLPRLFR